jgi:hypothetical protein
VPSPVCGSCVGRKCRSVAAECNDDLKKPGLEPARDHERVAAIVARAGEDEHARGVNGKHASRNFRRGKAGAFHQRSTNRAGLYRAQFRDTQDCIEAHGSDYRAAQRSATRRIIGSGAGH